MKNPRLLSCRFASVFLLGCALLALSPAPQAQAQKKMPPPVTITPALLDKVEKVTKGLLLDAAAMQELKAINKQDELDPTVADTDDAMAKKYPKLTALYRSAGLKPHEFIGAFITLLVAERNADGKASPDEQVSKDNIDFVKANRERVKAIIKTVTGEDE